MGYHFETEAGGDALPKVPEYWDLTGRIKHTIPSDPVFVSFNSVILDPYTQHIAIDTNDRLPPQEPPTFTKNGLTGLLHVVLNEPPVDGYIVDLRYVTTLTERVLGFTDPESVPEEIAAMNRAYLTTPVLGAIFVGLGTDMIHFPCEESKQELLQPYAESLMEFVDAERQKRGDAVVGTKSEPSAAHQSYKDAFRDTQ